MGGVIADPVGLYRVPSRASVWGLRSLPAAIVLVWVALQFLDQVVSDPLPTTMLSVVLWGVSLLIVLVGVVWAWQVTARPRPDPTAMQRLRRRGSDAQRTETARALRRGDALSPEQRHLAAAYLAGNTSLDLMTGNYITIAGAGVALVAEGATSVPMLALAAIWWVLALGSLAASIYMHRLRSAARAQGVPVGIEEP